MAEVDIRSARDRFHTRGDGVQTWHSFAYGQHYDPANVSFGPLRAVNEEIVEPGSGYDAHRHRDVEIVTWVLEGALAHRDSTGAAGVIEPGHCQRLSAGSGVEHVERNASGDESLRFVQMMLDPDAWGDEPTYRYIDISSVEGWHEGVNVGNARARLLVGHWEAGSRAALPDAELRHLHLTRGDLRVDGRTMSAGDCARITGADAAPGAGAIELVAESTAEVLLWLFDPPPPLR